MRCPSTPNKWKQVTKDFSNKWNFHNTSGAVDGNCVAIECLPSVGSKYFNYKKFRSVVLMVLIDPYFSGS